MRFQGQVLISFFESTRAALDGLALVTRKGAARVAQPPAAVVSRNPDGSRLPVEPPAAWPVGAAIGVVLGGLLGSFGGEAGVVIGLFFGLYAGIFVDVWRTLSRGDFLDEIQAGLAPGQAALVIFLGCSSATAIDRKLASTGGVTLHRFPGSPIEDDFAREVGLAVAEVTRLRSPDDHNEIPVADRALEIAAARRKLSLLQAIGDRLLWLERLDFGFQTHTLNRELRKAPRWRAFRLRRRVARVRAEDRRARTMIEASSVRARTAAG